MVAEETDGLWRAFVQSRDPAMRHRLILHYAALVKFVIGRLALYYPTILDAEDIRSIGTIGLIEAVDRFDPRRGIKFETYAQQRIRGEIIDALRRQDVVPRSVRQKARAIEAAMVALETELVRTPTDDEVAARLGISPEDYQRHLVDAQRIVLSLDSVDGSADTVEAVPLAERIAYLDGYQQPEVEAEQHELLEYLTEALGKLTEREKLVLKLYYYEQLTVREISMILSVSQPRVSQIHTRALLHLRGHLRARAVHTVAG